MYLTIGIKCFFTISTLFVIIVILVWFNSYVQGLRAGNESPYIEDRYFVILLFVLVIETLLFVGFFWVWFSWSNVPSLQYGSSYLPVGTISVDVITVPLRNTILLTGSAILVTMSHNSFTSKISKDYTSLLTISISICIIFLLLQGWEYSYLIQNSITDTNYWGIILVLTGTHGFHVITGTLFLSLSYIFIKVKVITTRSHLFYTFSVFYFHLVDVVWLFLFIFVYLI